MTNTKTRGRVLVSGASFAGLTTAFWMRRLGYDVTIVEVGAKMKHGGTPVDVRDATIGVVERMGLLTAIAARSLPGRATRFTEPDGTVIAELDPASPTADSTGDGYEIHRDDLLAILAEATAGDVEMLWSNSITTLTEHDDRVSVTFRDGTQRDFAMVFGCDGNHSAVRRLRFGPESKYSHFLRTYFSVAIVEGALLAPQTTQITNVPNVTLMLNSYDTTTDIVLGFHSDAEIPYDHHDQDEQKQIIRDRLQQAGSPFAELAERATTSESFYFDKLSQIRMNDWTTGRIALVGDAGYCASPAAGMGGSLAILGATALHDALAGTSGDINRAFREYEQSFRPIAEQIQHDAEHIGVPSYFPTSQEAIQSRNAMLLHH